jgi:hypothetical protein
VGSELAPQDSQEIYEPYKYARCNSCGWHVAVGDTTTKSLAEHLRDHVGDCLSEARHLMVPMWSVAWPYYWAVQNGTLPADHFGLEMEWRVAGSHTVHQRSVSIGSDPKEWFLFAQRAPAEGGAS